MVHRHVIRDKTRPSLAKDRRLALSASALFTVMAQAAAPPEAHLEVAAYCSMFRREGLKMRNPDINIGVRITSIRNL